MQLFTVYFSVYILTMLILCSGKSESGEPNQNVSKAHAIKLNTLFQFKLNKTEIWSEIKEWMEKIQYFRNNRRNTWNKKGKRLFKETGENKNNGENETKEISQ